MPLNVDHVLLLIFRKLERIERMLLNLTDDTEKEMTGLTDLQAQVAANTTVEQSAVTLIQGLKTQLDAAIAASQNGDDSQLEALSTQLATDDAALAAAITANTPAAAPAPSSSGQAGGA